MEARDPELRRELDATLQARGELGPEYESVLIDSFLEKVERRLAAARSASEPARPFGTFAERFGFGVVSLVLAVPLSAIGVANAGIDGLVVAWLGIVGVNAVHAAHTWPWARGRRRPSSDWDG